MWLLGHGTCDAYPFWWLNIEELNRTVLGLRYRWDPGSWRGDFSILKPPSDNFPLVFSIGLSLLLSLLLSSLLSYYIFILFFRFVFVCLYSFGFEVISFSTFCLPLCSFYSSPSSSCPSCGMWSMQICASDPQGSSDCGPAKGPCVHAGVVVSTRAWSRATESKGESTSKVQTIFQIWR